MSFTDYLNEQQSHQQKRDLEDSSNAFYWQQIQSEINHQDSSPFNKNHFGRLAQQIKTTDSQTVKDSLIDCCLFRLVYGLSELQVKYQTNQAHAEAEKQLNRIWQYKVSLYRKSHKELRDSLVAAFNRKSGTTHVTETASRTLHAIKTANEPTLVQLATTLLGGEND
ncbi:hypothetical protein EM59_016495 [Vibrio parahaemolyticus]|uniref:hypothetical protein n=1 Tax=Vibrio parahaemolyticus TaxID=670 RepID=UPI0004D3946D|nr:hypothetical protein [Vibrio parahaemolyticus]EGQ7650928.1 hypothetical protein [Vibrio parahaemolyticus]EGQ9979480.1 hypothetical protein [Vibrio parahaemolyticus]EJG1824810.1 hypothetical protein [Vibrio parahaemolyticus]ELB2744119.1 hypothetical protein [Vibrio parahaemolyticus]ELC9528618.1 hypothetical protein [Vibrio parahaemolyticus]